MTSRLELRRLMRSKRKQLTAAERRDAARRLARHFSSHRLFLHSGRIAAYFANDAELDPAPLLLRARTMKKTCYVPVLDTVQKNRLWFAQYDDAYPLVTNRFGIPEPAQSPRRYVSPLALDLILLPLVAFDPDGNRLGMGGGFYDRTLSFLMRRRRWQRPLLVGIAYEFQKITELQREPWDIPLHGIITDQRFYETS